MDVREERAMSCSFVRRGEVQEKFDALVEELTKSGSACYVTESGKPRAVIMDVDKYHAMMDIIEASAGGSTEMEIKLLRSALSDEPHA